VKRLLLFVTVTAVLWTAEIWWLNTQQADLSVRLALNQVNGGNGSARELRSFQAVKDSVQVATALLTLLVAVFTLGPLALKFAATPFAARLRKLFGSATPLLLPVAMLMSTSGCIKPYDKPEYVEIDTSETGFLIPLEGDGTQQAKFQSEDYLKQRKVAAKRVQITHRWSQEGRISSNGRWIPTVRLVKVNRSPVTREWMSPGMTNGEGLRRPGQSDQAIWIESGDSVGFSMGFTCTAFIEGRTSCSRRRCRASGASNGKYAGRIGSDPPGYDLTWRGSEVFYEE
jgi:hypothetical protein